MNSFLSRLSHFFLGDLSDKVRKMYDLIHILEREMGLESNQSIYLGQNNTNALSFCLDEMISRLNSVVGEVKNLNGLKLDNETQADYIADLKTDREKLLTECDSLKSQVATLHEKQKKRSDKPSSGHEVYEIKLKEGYEQRVSILLDLIHLRDDLAVMEKSKFMDLAEYAADLSESLSEIFEKNGMEVLSALPGSAVDTSYQRIVKTVPSNDSVSGGKIAGTLRQGYRYEGELLRLADVEVYGSNATISVSAQGD